MLHENFYIHFSNIVTASWLYHHWIVAVIIIVIIIFAIFSYASFSFPCYRKQMTHVLLHPFCAEERIYDVT